MLQHLTMKEYNGGNSWHGWSPRQKGWSSRVCPFQWWESESLSCKTMQENQLLMLRKFQHINMSNAIQLPAQWLFGTIYHLTTLWILVNSRIDITWYPLIPHDSPQVNQSTFGTRRVNHSPPLFVELLGPLPMGRSWENSIPICQLSKSVPTVHE